jgi:hypothetical protein
MSRSRNPTPLPDSAHQGRRQDLAATARDSDAPSLILIAVICCLSWLASCGQRSPAWIWARAGFRTREPMAIPKVARNRLILRCNSGLTYGRPYRKIFSRPPTEPAILRLKDAPPFQASYNQGLNTAG